MAGTRNLPSSLWLVSSLCMGLAGASLYGCQQKTSQAVANDTVQRKDHFVENTNNHTSSTTADTVSNTLLPNNTSQVAPTLPMAVSQPISTTHGTELSSKASLPIKEGHRTSTLNTRQALTQHSSQPILGDDSIRTSTSLTTLQQVYVTAIQSMTQKMTGKLDDADSLFVKNMLIHHQTALTFANIQLKYGKDETLQRLAQDTLMSQQAEAKVLAQWLTTHTNNKTANTNVKALQTDYTQTIQDMSDGMLKGVNASTADKIFVQVLLPHHKGALAMAESELRYGKDKTIREMAVNIISSQQGEITLMKNWLALQHRH